MDDVWWTKLLMPPSDRPSPKYSATSISAPPLPAACIQKAPCWPRPPWNFTTCREQAVGRAEPGGVLTRADHGVLEHAVGAGPRLPADALDPEDRLPAAHVHQGRARSRALAPSGRFLHAGAPPAGSRRVPPNSSPQTLRQGVADDTTLEATRAPRGDRLTARYLWPAGVLGSSRNANVPARLCRPETAVRQTAPSRRWMLTQACGRRGVKVAWLATNGSRLSWRVARAGFDLAAADELLAVFPDSAVPFPSSTCPQALSDETHAKATDTSQAVRFFMGTPAPGSVHEAQRPLGRRPRGSTRTRTAASSSHYSATSPVIFVSKAATWPTHVGHVKFFERIHNVATNAARVRNL